MKRYDMDFSCECGRFGDVGYYEEKNGEWLKYEDVKKPIESIIELYLGIHVSQLKNLPECVVKAWELGQEIYAQKIEMSKNL